MATVKLDGHIRIDYSPYFKLKGQFGSPSEEVVFDEKENPKMTAKAIRMRFELEDLLTEERYAWDYTVDIEKCVAPWPALIESVFQSLRRILPMQYELWEDWGSGADTNAVAATIGFTNRHTFERIRRSGFFFDGKRVESDYRITVVGDDGSEYWVNDNGVYEKDGNKVAGIWYEKPREKEDCPKVLYTCRDDEGQLLFIRSGSFSDTIRLLSQIPNHYREYTPGYLQKEEAVRRLRFLGVSEEQIAEFEKNGEVPFVTTDFDESIIRSSGTMAFLYSDRGWYLDEAYSGLMPYLAFRSGGAIPMVAYLYVEALRSESEIYRSELKEGKKQLIMTAIVKTLQPPYDCEIGSIVVEMTENGPIRVG